MKNLIEIHSGKTTIRNSFKFLFFVFHVICLLSFFLLYFLSYHLTFFNSINNDRVSSIRCFSMGFNATKTPR